MLIIRFCSLCIAENGKQKISCFVKGKNLSKCLCTGEIFLTFGFSSNTWTLFYSKKETLDNFV